MANNIVKELNEIKDNYDTEIKDGKNMVDALDGIREAIEQDGEYTSSKDVANAVKDLGVALKEHSGGETTFRNFTYTLVKDESGEYQNSQDILMWLPTYNDDNQITTFVGTDIEGETFNIAESFAQPVNKHCKLPVINGKCEVLFIATANVQLTTNASGCSLEAIEDPSGQLEWSSVYKLSILEDNANVEVIVLV